MDAKRDSLYHLLRSMTLDNTPNREAINALDSHQLGEMTSLVVGFLSSREDLANEQENVVHAMWRVMVGYKQTH